MFVCPVCVFIAGADLERNTDLRLDFFELTQFYFLLTFPGWRSCSTNHETAQQNQVLSNEKSEFGWTDVEKETLLFDVSET